VVEQHHNQTAIQYQRSSPGLRSIASLLSYIFHPVFVPLYVVGFLLYLHPSAFSGFGTVEKRQTLLIVALNLVFFPVFTVFLLRALRFIDSIKLKTQRDRIIPYIASGIFFFWGYTVFKQQPLYPLILTSFIFGLFLASSACLIANIYFKISMHTTGMGAWTGVFLIIMYRNEMLMTWPLAAVVLLTGLIFSSRLILASHTNKELYWGFAIGILAQIVAAGIV